ncbi:tetratricopeptide repeat protein [Nannocystis pusilla]|uniref:tetratricopeptide repeat protein n=1 Tax=Nannocystis pusilla TaxID=889268 RepID=UPI003BF06B3F
MNAARLWPMVSAIVLLLSGTAALEVVAHNTEGRVLTWEIRGDEVAMDGEGHDSDDESDDSQAAEAVNEAHADARLLARRGDYEQALARFNEAIASAPENAALVAEYGHWLRRAGRRAEADEALERALARNPESAPAHLDRALLARDRGDHEAALASFEQALRLRPMHTATRIAYADEILDLKRPDEAITLLKPVTEAGSNDRRARALAALGHAYAVTGRGSEAREAFEMAVERAPAVASLWARAALGLSQLGDELSAAEGLRYAQQAARLAPDSAYIADVVGRAYEHAGLEAEAYTSYQRALKLDGSLRHPRQRLVRMALDREDFAAARRNAQGLLDLDPRRPDANFLVGLVEFKAGRLQEARNHFQEAIAASSTPYAEAWYNLGLLERAAERPEAAIVAYKRAIEARPQYLAAINNLGLVYGDLERHVEAETQYRRALDIDPNYTAAWTNLARAQAASGRHDEALVAYRRVLEIDPNERSARLQVAVTLRKAGRADEAIAEYRTLLEQHPRYVKAWFNLGIALAAEAQNDEALAAYEQALAHDQDHFGARKNLGLLLLRLERVDAAHEHLTEALEVRPADPEIRLALAEIARRTGDAATCTMHVDTILRQQADDPSALNLREKCAAN